MASQFTIDGPMPIFSLITWMGEPISVKPIGRGRFDSRLAGHGAARVGTPTLLCWSSRAWR